MTNEADMLDAAAKKLRDGTGAEQRIWMWLSPPIALALADWLDEPCGADADARAVARAILGPGWAMQQAAADSLEEAKAGQISDAEWDRNPLQDGRGM